MQIRHEISHRRQCYRCICCRSKTNQYAIAYTEPKNKNFCCFDYLQNLSMLQTVHGFVLNDFFDQVLKLF